MFGLTALRNQVQLHTTLDKLIFIVENVWENSHRLTMIIGFSALAILLAVRSLKGFFKRYTLIYRLPEVLLVVVFSTCELCSVLVRRIIPKTLVYQFCRTSWIGTNRESRYLAQFRSIRDRTLSSPRCQRRP